MSQLLIQQYLNEIQKEAAQFEFEAEMMRLKAA